MYVIAYVPAVDPAGDRRPEVGSIPGDPEVGDIENTPPVCCVKFVGNIVGDPEALQTLLG